MVYQDGKSMTDDKGRPKSYLISVLIITAFNRVPYFGMPFKNLVIRYKFLFSNLHTIPLLHLLELEMK